MSPFDYITLAISLAALAVATLTAISQHEASDKANAVMTAELLREHTKPPFSRARYYILHQKLVDSDPSKGMKGISDDQRPAVTELLGFYDLIGSLRAHKLVDRRIIDNLLGVAAKNAYAQMRPYISKERALQDQPYMHYFEHWVTSTSFTPLTIKSNSTTKGWLHKIVPLWK